ncbi:hypothetical protein CC78DRAFT_493963 [Lojkania enalia]|uniref:Methyltransferase n=1 Tax=Lojkania enalia TaxID=147567 RepID=A0A9P4KB33_9PLEO|nr:hypothetical protein CC78DRAFT_493963 [Didymosphaeria enalia]
MGDENAESSYVMHSDSELTRLTLQHEMIKDAMGGQLVIAPLDLRASSLQILDCCTADGVWIRELQSSLPPEVAKQHTFVGTDNEKSYFPHDPPKNTTYYVQDVHDPWPVEWSDRFDLVHQRLALACPGDEEATKSTIRDLIRMVKPEGWIQLVEFIEWTDDEDGPAWKDYTTCLCDMIAFIGSTVKHIDHVKDWFQDLGLVNVEEKVFEGNYGTRQDKMLQATAMKAVMMTATMILGVTSSLPQEMLRVSKDRIPNILTDLEKEMKADQTHAHWRYKVVWGRKPE